MSSNEKYWLDTIDDLTAERDEAIKQHKAAEDYIQHLGQYREQANRYGEALEDIRKMTSGYPHDRARAAIEGRCPWWRFASADRHELGTEHCTLANNHAGTHSFAALTEPEENK